MNINDLKDGDIFIVQIRGRYDVHTVVGNPYEEYYTPTNKVVKRVNSVVASIYTKKDSFHDKGVHISWDKGRSEVDIKNYKNITPDETTKMLLIKTIFKYGVTFIEKY